MRKIAWVCRRTARGSWLRDIQRHRRHQHMVCAPNSFAHSIVVFLTLGIDGGFNRVSAQSAHFSDSVQFWRSWSQRPLAVPCRSGLMKGPTIARDTEVAGLQPPLQVGRLSLRVGSRRDADQAPPPRRSTPRTSGDQWSPITSTAALIVQPERGSLAGQVAMT
jgi:hypothetical protein